MSMGSLFLLCFDQNHRLLLFLCLRGLTMAGLDFFEPVHSQIHEKIVLAIASSFVALLAEDFVMLGFGRPLHQSDGCLAARGWPDPWISRLYPETPLDLALGHRALNFAIFVASVVKLVDQPVQAFDLKGACQVVRTGMSGPLDFVVF